MLGGWWHFQEKLLMGFPADFTVSPLDKTRRCDEVNKERQPLLGNAWHVDVAAFILKAILSPIRSDVGGPPKDRPPPSSTNEMCRSSWRRPHAATFLKLAASCPIEDR